MRYYETVAIVKMDAPETALANLGKKVEKILNAKPGKMINKEDWGVKKLAYAIKKEKEGRYICWSYWQGPKTVGELERKLKFEEHVLRYMTVVTEDPAKLDSLNKDKKTKNAGSEDGESGKNSSFRKKNIVGRGERLTHVNYKDLLSLNRFVTDRGKIVPRRISGIDCTSQKAVSTAVKRARQIALLSYTQGVSFPSSEEKRGAEL